MGNEETVQKEKPKNEFDDLNVDDKAPGQTFSETPEQGQESMVAAGDAGQKYDWSKAPEGSKAPPRVDMNGKEVTIKKVDIILPPKSREWVQSKSGKTEYKYCTFSLFYDFEGQQEFYSGVRVFKRDNDMYSHPTIMRDRVNQSSQLLGLYADYKKKDINEISLREFMGFLNSQPKVLIKTETVVNPTNQKEIHKNFVAKFL